MDNLIELLKIDRNFVNQNDPHSEILESIVKSMLQDTTIYFVKSNIANHFVYNSDTNIIVWDSFYWDLFEKHLRLVQEAEASIDNLDKMTRISRLVLSNFSYYISSKFEDNIDLSIIMLRDSIEYGYKKLHRYNYSLQEMPLVLCKLFTLLHEIAHIIFDGDILTKNTYFKYIRENLCQKDDDELFSMATEYWDIDDTLVQASINSLLYGEDSIVLEELAADHFALVQTFHYAIIVFREIGDKSTIAYLLKKAITALLNFNNYINNLNVEWNFMIPAIKLKVLEEDFFSSRITKNRFRTNLINLLRDNISLSLMYMELFRLGGFPDDDTIFKIFLDEAEDLIYYDRFFWISLRHSLLDEKYIMERVIGANKLSLTSQLSHIDKLAIREKIIDSVVS